MNSFLSKIKNISVITAATSAALSFGAVCGANIKELADIDISQALPSCEFAATYGEPEDLDQKEKNSMDLHKIALIEYCDDTKFLFDDTIESVATSVDSLFGESGDNENYSRDENISFLTNYIYIYETFLSTIGEKSEKYEDANRLLTDLKNLKKEFEEEQENGEETPAEDESSEETTDETEATTEEGNTEEEETTESEANEDESSEETTEKTEATTEEGNTEEEETPAEDESPGKITDETEATTEAEKIVKKADNEYCVFKKDRLTDSDKELVETYKLVRGNLFKAEMGDTEVDLKDLKAKVEELAKICTKSSGVSYLKSRFDKLTKENSISLDDSKSMKKKNEL